MKDFDVCSLWSECSKVMKCIHPDTGEISAVEWEHACTTARRYKKGINYFVCNGNNQTGAREKKTASIIENTNQNSKPSLKKILIVDGNSIINRAYYGTPMLRAPDGRPTNAVYGALRTLIAAAMARNPTHMLVAMDYPGKTFRYHILPEYKAAKENYKAAAVAGIAANTNSRQ